MLDTASIVDLAITGTIVTGLWRASAVVYRDLVSPRTGLIPKWLDKTLESTMRTERHVERIADTAERYVELANGKPEADQCHRSHPKPKSTQSGAQSTASPTNS